MGAKRNIRQVVFGLLLALAITGPAWGAGPAGTGRYGFDGSISREVLENYLARSVTFYELQEGRGDLDDHVRLITNIGAKFIGLGLFLWGREASLEARLAAAAPAVARIRQADGDIILQAGIFEIVSEEVNQIPIPAWVFAEFGQPVESRNFEYEAMIYPAPLEEPWTIRNYWAPGASVPDMSRLETRMWFFFLAARYIDLGYEAIHFGQINIMDGNDPGHLHWLDLLGRVRAYAKTHARRHFVLCDAHVWGGGWDGGIENGRLLFDFLSFPLRIEEAATPTQAMLVMGHEDSIYGRSAGGITPSGWACEHLPYLVALDNWGASGQEGQDIGTPWIWGYDEISWFANQEEAYRNQFLRYAWNWVRGNDPNGYVQMPVSKVLTSPAGGREWYYAHTPSPATPDGFNQEETIKAIWRHGVADFDDLPTTTRPANPGDSGAWLYTTGLINPDPDYPMTAYDWAGWRSTTAYPAPNQDIFNFYYLYLNTYNSRHMGFSTYGYPEIDNSRAIRGHSLRYRVTGGRNSAGEHGLAVTTKQHYLDYLAQGQDPVAHGGRVGHPYLYFANNSPSGGYVAMPEAQGANRLSTYYHAPAGLTNGPGGWGNRPEPTMNLGPYNGVGGHWYHEICNQGGGWTHVLADGHPQHNNAWSSADYPYPSSSLRDLGEGYFNGWYRWYITFKPYEGIADPPYDVWIDEIEFRHDPEPQNNETIASPAVTWLPSPRTFEIGFMDKYKNNQYSYSTYELRYAFTPITNATWDSATPAHILADARFAISARGDGRFAKHWPYYQSVWAPFTLASPADLNRLTAGTIIHFAVKDISQVNGDSMQPIIDTGIGRWPIGGRDYQNHGDTFDYAGDQAALPLIKRIDFQIPGEPGPAKPGRPNNLKAKPISATEVVLSWIDQADNETGFRIERKQGLCSAPGTWSRISGRPADAQTFIDTGLTPATGYSYRLRAQNGTSHSGFSNCGQATTAKVGTPRAPEHLKAVAVSSTAVRLSWTDRSNDETRFKLFRKAGTDPWTLLANLPAGTTSHKDTTAAGNHATTGYSYQVRACNAAGCSPATQPAVVPFAPIGLNAATAADRIELTWTDRAANETGCRIFRKEGVCPGPGWAKLTELGADANGYVDTGVSVGTAYSFRIRAAHSSAPPAAVGYSLWSNCAGATAGP